MTLYRDMPALDRAISEESHDWLRENAPQYYDAVAEEVRAGATPDQVYHYIMRRAGPHREPLALRCKLTAQHLVALRAVVGDTAKART